MSATIIHAILIILAIAASFIFSSSPLASYDLQVGAICFIILYLTRRFFPVKTFVVFQAMIFTFAVTTIILTTGTTHSSFFFLFYFLLFAVGLLLEPIISMSTTITLVLFLLFSLPPNQDLKELLPILSLAIITPFAWLLGQESMKNAVLEKRVMKDTKDTYLFLSLVIKNHVKAIKNTVENYQGDHHLADIEKSVQEMERLIDEYEQKK